MSEKQQNIEELIENGAKMHQEKCDLLSFLQNCLNLYNHCKKELSSRPNLHAINKVNEVDGHNFGFKIDITLHKFGDD
jgi:hypothetical protein